jgi:ATP-dependent DNA ligase
MVLLRERTRPGLGIIEPCLPSPAKVPPSGPGWLHEIKHDGFRVLARRDGAGVTRHGTDFTSLFPLVAAKQVTIESLIAEAEAARAKAMSERGGAAAAVSALTAKAKLAGMWREKVDQHNTGTGTVSTVWSVSWDEEVEQSDGREAG